MKRTRLENSCCPVARSLDVIGDWWSLLIVRDALRGVRRFSEFQKNLGIAKNTLAGRLKMLVDEGILHLQPASDGSAWQGDWVLVSDAQGAMPQRLRLDRSQGPDTQHIRIASADGSATLDCDAGSAQAAWPPRACTLQLADGSIDRFDSVAVTRMDGTDANGAAVHLLRIKP